MLTGGSVTSEAETACQKWPGGGAGDHKVGSLIYWRASQPSVRTGRFLLGEHSDSWLSSYYDHLVLVNSMAILFVGRAQRARTSELNVDSVCMYVYWASAASPY